jgi:Zn-dependent metalloprotease
MHRGDPAMAERFDQLRERRAGLPAFAGIAATVGEDLSRLDPESAARHHLQQALDDQSIPELTAPRVDDGESEFTRLGAEYLPLTGTRTVKFRQSFNDIPVYGSLVTVELDEGNECLAINTAMGEPKGVDPIATVSPARIAARLPRLTRIPRPRTRPVPRLHYYFDGRRRRWRLAYIVEGAPIRWPDGDPGVMDFVFDAHSAALISRRPRTPGLSAATETAVDDLGEERTFACEVKAGAKTLRDPTLNVRTCDFEWKDPDAQYGELPGNDIQAPPAPWDPSAVSAHANASEVVRFLREVLRRNNIDNRGGEVRSSIRCVPRGGGPKREWLNAYWNGAQMVYGQRRQARGFLTMAANLDVVAHEMFHGVTARTARLEYAGESGALNESYSDIFGAIISNRREPDPRRWDWKIGEGLRRDGNPYRDLSHPEKHLQPRNMRHYRHKPMTKAGDWGGVHDNSGIHSYAAYRLLTATRGRRLVFRPEEVATLFYLCLSQYLSRTSDFAASLRGVILVARSLFRHEPPASQELRVRAIRSSFAAAGIGEMAAAG